MDLEMSWVCFVSWWFFPRTTHHFLSPEFLLRQQRCSKSLQVMIVLLVAEIPLVVTSSQYQAGRGPEQADLVTDIPVHGTVLEWGDL